MLVGFSEGKDCDGGLFLEEEETTHPDQIPLLALRQIDDDGLLYGEVWFQPADLPHLIAALTEQHRLNYSARARRWRGMPDGPMSNMVSSPRLDLVSCRPGRRGADCPSWARIGTLLIQRGCSNRLNSSNLLPFTRVRVTRCWSLLGSMLDFAVLYSLKCQSLPMRTRFPRQRSRAALAPASTQRN
jgi:hypothetical protein